MDFAYTLKKHDYLISHYLYSVLPSYIFTIDILLSFFKGYYKKGKKLNNKSIRYFDYLVERDYGSLSHWSFYLGFNDCITFLFRKI